MNIVKREIGWIISKAVNKFNKRDNKLWVFGEWLGNRCCGNSLFLANYVAENHPELRLVWLSKENIDLSLLDSRVERVVMDTPKAIEILKKAGVAIMNQGLVDLSESMTYYSYGAVNVNLWHGIPWKKIGLDIVDKKSIIDYIYGRYILNLQKPSLFVALSDEMKEKVLNSFLLKEKNIIESGYPRNSIFYDENRKKMSKKKIIAFLNENYGCKFEDDVKIITYMPTFRDKAQNSFSFANMIDNEELNALLTNNKAIIIEKAHFVTSQRTSNEDNNCNQNIFGLNNVNSQELLASTELLITDYSSCFFDFLMMDKPIIHFTYDYEYYANKDRGLYYDKKDVACGDVVENQEDLLASIADNLKNPNKNQELRLKRREHFMSYESEDSCKKIYEAILFCLKK